MPGSLCPRMLQATPARERFSRPVSSTASSPGLVATHGVGERIGGRAWSESGEDLPRSRRRGGELESEHARHVGGGGAHLFLRRAGLPPRHGSSSHGPQLNAEPQHGELTTTMHQSLMQDSLHAGRASAAVCLTRCSRDEVGSGRPSDHSTSLSEQNGHLISGSGADWARPTYLFMGDMII
jgi:hypothetical protein